MKNRKYLILIPFLAFPALSYATVNVAPAHNETENEKQSQVVAHDFLGPNSSRQTITTKGGTLRSTGNLWTMEADKLNDLYKPKPKPKPKPKKSINKSTK